MRCRSTASRIYTSPDTTTKREDLIVDSHAAAVIDPVWHLLDVAYARFGVLPTLLERDFKFPPLSELIGELDHIRAIQAKHTVVEQHVRTA